LKDGEYVLKIDDEPVGSFTAKQFEHGLNLSTLPTPMLKQAAAVHKETLHHNNIHFLRWRQVQVPLQSEDQALLEPALKSLDALESVLVKNQRALAQPKPHRFELSRKAG
jgi:hypothetical protein